MEVKNLKAILDENKELVIVSAEIDEVLHYTADIRSFPNKSGLVAVFSDITKYNKLYHDGIDHCIESKLYSSIEIGFTDIFKNHYIWINTNYQNRITNFNK